MGRIDVTLVAGGMYHDIDFARRELLALLGEHEEFRVRVQPDYEDTDGITASSILVSYTCNVRPSVEAQQTIRSWVEGGGRWVALHGTNSALDVGTPNGVDSPRVFPLWADTLGSQFVAHPPIMPYLVELATDDHWLVDGIEPFETDDELYLSEHADREALIPLLETTWSGDARGFVEHDWTDGTRSPPRDVPARARRRRRALQHPRPLPRPLRHGPRGRLLPQHRTGFVGATRLLRTAPSIPALGPRRDRLIADRDGAAQASTAALTTSWKRCAAQLTGRPASASVRISM